MIALTDYLVQCAPTPSVGNGATMLKGYHAKRYTIIYPSHIEKIVTNFMVLPDGTVEQF